MQAWQDQLERRGQVSHIDIFVGKDSQQVPVLFDEKYGIGNDRNTFEMLRMWYCWIQVKRGFGEILLPRKLVRIYKARVRQPHRT